MVLILLRTGMRIGELLTARIRDVNVKERTITIFEGRKNRRGRVVYLSDDALCALKGWLKEVAVTAGAIDNTKAYMRGSIADMRSLLVDVGNNVPKGQQSFKKVDDERIRDRCNFRKVCD